MFIKLLKYIFNFIIPNYIFLYRKNIKFKDIPSCNQKLYITGLGKVEIGESCSFGYKLGGFYRGGCVELQARYNDAFIVIGNNVLMNNNVFILSANHIEIGDRSLIGQYVTIMDHEAHGTDPNNRLKIGEVGRVSIGSNVWIGNNVVILKNSSIGDNSIVAAGSIVSGNYPDNAVIGGVPAKFIKPL